MSDSSSKPIEIKVLNIDGGRVVLNIDGGRVKVLNNDGGRVEVLNNDGGRVIEIIPGVTLNLHESEPQTVSAPAEANKKQQHKYGADKSLDLVYLASADYICTKIENVVNTGNLSSSKDKKLQTVLSHSDNVEELLKKPAKSLILVTSTKGDAILRAVLEEILKELNNILHPKEANPQANPKAKKAK